MQRRAKTALTYVGSRCSARTIHRLNAAVNYLEVGRWMRARGFDVRRVQRRTDVFEAIADQLKRGSTLYLEFGVYEGESMRWWSQRLRDPAARLHGFDSFEGLPEKWSIGEGRGHFSTGGRLPDLDDPRVQFFKGWFEETLPPYDAPPHAQLVVALDADVYSSTSFVLAALHERALIRSGTFLYFDEFHDRIHELRAFDEFLDRSALRFRAVAATAELSHVAFRCDG